MKKIFCSALLGSALFGGNVAQVNASPITLELIGTATSIAYGSYDEIHPYTIWDYHSINQSLVERITFDSSYTYKEDDILWAGDFGVKIEIYLDGKLSYTTWNGTGNDYGSMGNYGYLSVAGNNSSHLGNSLSIYTAGPADWPYLNVSINDPILNDPNWFNLSSWKQSHSFKLDSGMSIGSLYNVIFDPAIIQLHGTIYEAKLNPSPVPVPAAVWLFGSGLVGLLGFNRKRSKLLAS